MSFGTSAGDIILLIQLAHKNYRNCKEAGGEYIEIAREVRSLHSVLRTVRDEAEREDSLLFSAGPDTTKELTEIADGCRGVLEGIDVLLTKYKGLAPESSEVGKASKIWQRFRFGTEIEDLEKMRWKIITYTSTLAVLVDSISLKATGRVGDVAGRIETQMLTGFAEMHDRMERFEDMRKAVLFIATRARASQRYQAMESVLSLSTYADDDKEVWRLFRSQLVSLGFKSDSLDRHMEVLKAYMMKLVQTGVLDEAVAQNAPTTQSWCGNASFRTTNLSLLGIVEDEQSSPEAQQEEITSRQKSASSGYIPTQQATPALQSPSTDPGLGEEADGVADAEIPLETTATQRRRVLRIKVDQPIAVEDSNASRASKDPSTDAAPINKSHEQSSTSSMPNLNTDTGIDVSKPRPSRPYAESYYPASEAASSHPTLLRGMSGKKAAPKRPQQPSRPTSWAGPDVGKPKRGHQASLHQIDDNSDLDSTVGMPRWPHRTSKRDNGPVIRKERIDDWLEPTSQRQGTRARISPTQQKPRSFSEEGVPPVVGRGLESPERLLSTSESRTKVKFEEPTKSPNIPPSDADFSKPKKKPAADAYGDIERQMHKTRSARPMRFPADKSTFGSKNTAGENFSFDYKQKGRSRSPEATVNGKGVPSSQFQQAAKAALLAGATEAFRSRNETGSWGGEKGRRILSAAIGAGSIGASSDPELRPGRTGKMHIMEAVIGGLAGNRLLNREREARRKASGFVESDSAYDSASDSDMRDSDRSRGRGRKIDGSSRNRS